MPSGYFIARKLRDTLGKNILDSARDHVQRPLAWCLREDAERCYSMALRREYSLWYTWDGHHASPYIKGLYDETCDNDTLPCPTEILYELAWLEYAPNSSSGRSWATGDGIVNQVDIGCQQSATVHIRREGVDVFGPGAKKAKFQSLAEAINFLNTCRNSLEGVISEQIATDILSHAFQDSGCPPEAPPIVDISAKAAKPSHIVYNGLTIPVWTCNAESVSRHWLRRTMDPVLDQAHSKNVYEDAYGAITAMPVSDSHLKAQSPADAKRGPLTATAEVPAPHADRANTWLTALGMSSRIVLENGKVWCEPCPGEGTTLRSVMKRLGFVREQSHLGRLCWGVPSAKGAVLMLESSSDLFECGNEEKPKGGMYIDLQSGKDFTKESCRCLKIHAENMILTSEHGPVDIPPKGTRIRSQVIMHAGHRLIETTVGDDTYYSTSIEFQTPVVLEVQGTNLIQSSRGKLIVGQKASTVVSSKISQPIYDQIRVVPA